MPKNDVKVVLTKLSREPVFFFPGRCSCVRSAAVCSSFCYSAVFHLSSGLIQSVFPHRCPSQLVIIILFDVLVNLTYCFFYLVAFVLLPRGMVLERARFFLFDFGSCC